MALSKTTLIGTDPVQSKRRINDLVDTVVNQVGSINTNSGDIGKLNTEINGNLSFGTIGAKGNLKGQFFTVTTPGANTEFSITHSLGAVPTAVFTAWISNGGSIYQGPTTGTAWTTTTVYLKCTTAAATISVFITIP